MQSNLIEKLSEQLEERKAKSLAEFAALAHDVADCKNRKPAEVEGILTSSGKDISDLSHAVEGILRMRELKALYATATDLVAETKRLAGTVATERQKLEELTKANRVAEKLQSDLIVNSEREFQASVKVRDSALGSERELQRLAAVTFPELAAELHQAEQSTRIAQQQKAAIEKRVADKFFDGEAGKSQLLAEIEEKKNAIRDLDAAERDLRAKLLQA
jgi:hypothetical protein